MTGIFISYREADAVGWATWLRDELVEVFGADQVYFAKDTQQAGNWREQIQRALDRCKVVLVIIGPQWLTIADEQDRPRIHLPDDVLHQEVAYALSRSDVIVIPVLVGEAPLPRKEQLPQDLHKLLDQQARKIGDTQGRRKADLEVLIKDIESVGGVQRHSRPHGEDSSPPVISPSPSPTRTSLPKVDVGPLSGAFALTLLAGMYAYLSNHELDSNQLFFLLLVSYGLLLGVRWLWRRTVAARRRKT